MKNKKMTVTIEELEKALIGGQAKTNDDGYFTVQQWADMWDITIDSARCKIRNATSAGMVDISKIYSDNKLGHRRCVNGYKITLPD